MTTVLPSIRSSDLHRRSPSFPFLEIGAVFAIGDGLSELYHHFNKPKVEKKNNDSEANNDGQDEKSRTQKLLSKDTTVDHEQPHSSTSKASVDTPDSTITDEKR